MAATLIRKADERFAHLPVLQFRTGSDCYDLQMANERMHLLPSEPVPSGHGLLAPAPSRVSGEALQTPVLRRDEVKCGTPLTCACGGRVNKIVHENDCMTDTPLVAGGAFTRVYAQTKRVQFS